MLRMASAFSLISGSILTEMIESFFAMVLSSLPLMFIEYIFQDFLLVLPSVRDCKDFHSFLRLANLVVDDIAFNGHFADSLGVKRLVFYQGAAVGQLIQGENRFGDG